MKTAIVELNLNEALLTGKLVEDEKKGRQFKKALFDRGGDHSEDAQLEQDYVTSMNTLDHKICGLPMVEQATRLTNQLKELKDLYVQAPRLSAAEWKTLLDTKQFVEANVENLGWVGDLLAQLKKQEEIILKLKAAEGDNLQ